MPSESAVFFPILRKLLASSCGSELVIFSTAKSGYATLFAIFAFILLNTWRLVYNLLDVLCTDKLRGVNTFIYEVY